MPEIKIANNTDILYRYWECDNPKAIFLLVHGLGAHSDRWEFMGQFFKSNGFSSYAIELKGFGETTNLPRGHIDSFNIYYKDILKLVDLIKKENPDKKIFLLGESMGALIAFVLTGNNPKIFSGLILISPAFKNGMKIPVLTQMDAFTSLLYNSKKIFCMPFTSAMCTRDALYKKLMDQDNRELRYTTPKTLFNILLAQFKSLRLLKKLNTPSLFLISGKDYLIDESQSRNFFNRLALKDKTIIEYSEMYHALSIDLGKEKVFEDILSWVNKRY